MGRRNGSRCVPEVKSLLVLNDPQCSECGSSVFVAHATYREMRSITGERRQRVVRRGFLMWILGRRSTGRISSVGHLEIKSREERRMR